MRSLQEIIKREAFTGSKQALADIFASIAGHLSSPYALRPDGLVATEDRPQDAGEAKKGMRAYPSRRDDVAASGRAQGKSASSHFNGTSSELEVADSKKARNIKNSARPEPRLSAEATQGEGWKGNVRNAKFFPSAHPEERSVDRVSNGRAQTLPSSTAIGSATGPATFDQFVFDPVGHQAYIASSSDAATGIFKASPGVPASAQPTLTAMTPATVTLNGAAGSPNPLSTAKIAQLVTYGSANLPAAVVVAADDKDPKPQNVYVITDATAGSTVLSNTAALTDAAGTKINQPVVALTAAHGSGYFFPVVADGGKVGFVVPKMPDDTALRAQIRKSFIDGIGKLRNTNKLQDNGFNATKASLTPPQASDGNNDREALIKAMSSQIIDAFYHSSNSNRAAAPLATQEYKQLLDLSGATAIPALTATVVGGAVNANNIVNAFGADNGRVLGIVNEPQIAVQFGVGPNDANDVAAAALQVMAGQALHDLLQAPGDPLIAADVSKPFPSLDARQLVVGDAAATNYNVYVADADGINRGVAFLQTSAGGLAAADNAGNPIAAGPLRAAAMFQGVKIATTVGQPFANGIPCAAYSSADTNPITRAIIRSTGEADSGAELLWDDHLQKLFVGFHDVTVGDGIGTTPNNSGGACAVMLGELKTDKIFLQPIIKNMHPLLFQTELNPDGLNPADLKPVDPINYMVGFYQKFNKANVNPAIGQELHASAKNLKVMHTSTGKSYLIFNGGVATGATFANLNSKVYALPLVDTVYDADAKVASLTGHIAQRKPTYVNNTEVTQLVNKINFDKAVGQWNDYTAADQSGTLTAVLESVGGSAANDFVFDAVVDVATNGLGGNNAKYSAGKIQNSPEIIAGLGSLALQAAYGVRQVPHGAVGNDDKAAEAALALIQGNYAPNARNNPTKPSNLLDLTEQASLINKAARQAPASAVSTLLQNTAMQAAATTADKTQLYKALKGAVFTGGAQGSVDDGKTGAAVSFAGGIGYALNKIYDGGAGANIRDTQLLPAIHTMHVDVPDYPDFDYVRVGSNPKLLSFDTTAPIADLQVVGDTVYATLGNARDTNHTSDTGMFASTALFADDGHITRWTPWERVGGQITPVSAVGVDPSQGRTWYATRKDGAAITPTTAADTINITQWGMSAQPAGTDSTVTSTATFTGVADVLFGDTGGVMGLFDFDPYTQGFRQGDQASATPALRQPQLSMMVATSDARVALIQTGAYDPGSQLFKPTTNFTSGANVFVFDVASDRNAGTALGEIGAITCAEVSRMPLSNVVARSNDGWLFVGGQGGVAVLTQWYNGQGWDTTIGGGLDYLRSGNIRGAFPGAPEWRFLQLLDANGNNIFNHVRRIMSDQNRWLYVLTAKELWRVDMTNNAMGLPRAYSNFIRDDRRTDAAKDYTCNLPAAAYQLVASVAASTSNGVNARILDDGDELLDMLVTYRNNTAGSTQILLGSSRGLFSNVLPVSPIADVVPNVAGLQWNPVKAVSKDALNAAQTPRLGAVFKMDFDSSQLGQKLRAGTTDKTAFYADGNVRVVAAEEKGTYIAAYRFDVRGDAGVGNEAKKFTEPTAAAVTPFAEPYHKGYDAKETTPYFYKLGDLVGDAQTQIDPQGPLDFYPQSSDVVASSSSFAQTVPMLPDPAAMVASDAFGVAGDIDLGLELTLPLSAGSVVRSSATGTLMVPGEFGVRVSE